MTSQHRAVAKAAWFLAVANLASRLLGLVREMLIAREFGQGGLVSAYTSAFNLPDLLFFFMSSGALSAAFVPVLTERFRTGREKEAWEVFSIIACLMGLVLSATIALSWVFAKPLVAAVAVPGFVTKYPHLVPVAVLLTRIILPCQLFFLLGGIMSGVLEARQNFKIRAAGPVIYNIGIIFGALVLSRWFSIAGLAWGTIIGAFAGNILYAFYCLRKAGYEFHWNLNLRHPGVVRVGQLALPVILGLGLPQIDVIVNRWFASFVSESAPAALNYANRLMQVPLGIFAQAAGTAILPTLAAYAAKNAMDDMRSGISYGLRSVFVESIPSTVFLIVMATPIIRAIYMGGQFKPSDVYATAIPLIAYSAGIFAWSGQMIVARGFFALQDTWTPILVGTVATVIFIPLNYILMHALGTGGIALATTIAVSLHFFGLTWFLRKRLNGIEGGRIIKSVAKVCLASAVLGIVCYGVLFGVERYADSHTLTSFAPNQMRDPASLALRLDRPKDHLTRYIAGTLPANTRAMLSDFSRARRADDKAAMPPRLKQAIADSLNDVIGRGLLLEAADLAGRKLSQRAGEMVLLAESDGTDTSVRMANHRLLEEAYSDEIGLFSQGKRVALIAVLLAMVLGGVAYAAMLKALKVEEADVLWSLIRKLTGGRRGGQTPTTEQTP